MINKIEQFGENVTVKIHSTNDPTLKPNNMGGVGNTPPSSQKNTTPSCPISGFASAFDYLRGKGFISFRY